MGNDWRQLWDKIMCLHKANRCSSVFLRVVVVGTMIMVSMVGLEIRVNVVPVHAMKVCKGSRALDSRGWLTSRFGRFTPVKEPQFALNRRWGRPQSRSGCFREEKNLFPLPRFNPRFVKPVALLKERVVMESMVKLQLALLTLWRLTTYIYTSYRTANLQTLHFKYLLNKYTYWIF